MRWYVVKAVSGRETSCREQVLASLKAKKLESFVGQLLIPSERITELKRGKKVTAERKLYPGYIYIEMELSQDVLETVNDVDGITGFLGADPRNPDPLTAEEADRIIRIASASTAEEQRKELVQIPFQLEDSVKVKEGTFSGMEGVVAEINAQKGLLKVMITVFGRQTPVELEVWQVEPVV
jgi:transcriptional antiterminator NusG